MAEPSSSHESVVAALIGNVLVALTKTGAALWTGSSAMLSEALHSFVDCANEVLLLYGQRRSATPPDLEHPLGHGRELYFWSFIVAVLIFALGAGLSLYQGFHQILHPAPIRDPAVSYIVLALAGVFEGASWLIAMRLFRASMGKAGFWETFRKSKDPPSFMVLFEDTAAVLGLLTAALGTFMATTLNLPVFDGIASVLIGVQLAGVAILLARESKSLLIGESANRELMDSIERIAAENAVVSRVNGVLTVQLAPDQILVALSLEFSDDLRVPDLEMRVVEIERSIRTRHPEVSALFVKPQTHKVFRAMVRHRFIASGH